MFLQFNNLEFKVSSESILVKLNPSCQSVDIRHLHVVDQRVAVLPGDVIRAAQGRELDNLEGFQNTLIQRNIITHRIIVEDGILRMIKYTGNNYLNYLAFMAICFQFLLNHFMCQLIFYTLEILRFRHKV